MTPGPAASKSQWRSYFREQLRQLTLAERAAASSQIRDRLEARREWQEARAVLLFAPTPDEPDVLPLARAALAAGKTVTLPRYCPTTDSYEAARVGRHASIARSRLPLPRSERGRGSGRGGDDHGERLTESKGPLLPGPLLPRREERESAVPDLGTMTGCSPHVADIAGDLAPGRFGILEPVSKCPQFPLNELDFSLVPGIGFGLDGGRLGRGRGYFDRLLAAIAGFKCGVAFDCQVVTEIALEPHDICLDCILTPTRWHLTASRARS